MTFVTVLYPEKKLKTCSDSSPRIAPAPSFQCQKYKIWQSQPWHWPWRRDKNPYMLVVKLEYSPLSSLARNWANGQYFHITSFTKNLQFILLSFKCGISVCRKVSPSHISTASITLPCGQEAITIPAVSRFLNLHETSFIAKNSEFPHFEPIVFFPCGRPVATSSLTRCSSAREVIISLSSNQHLPFFLYWKNMSKI